MIAVAATRNRHKIEEIGAIMGAFGFTLQSQSEAGLEAIDVTEDGDTFEANSLKKAMAIYQACGKTTVADDSGLMVDALDGAPGVYSARFSGEGATDQSNNEKLLHLLGNLPLEERSAKFVAVITLILESGEKIVVRGECPGTILFAPKGEGGFGYDPLFCPEGYEESFSELGPEIKNKISHRAKALQALDAELKRRGVAYD